MKLPRLLLFVFAAAGCLYGQAACDSLRMLSLPAATITAVEMVAAATRPNGLKVPAHCRVALTLTPSPDSEIKAEVWMPPLDAWNGKFQAVGNGGWAGNIGFVAMASALQDGYATAGTDTGHTGGSGAFAVGHPEKVVDFAYRSVHETVLKAKALVTAFYGRGPRLSYWNGCSTGGRQGLMEAQRYPDDFDAILAGAPANYHLHLHAAQMANEVRAILRPEASLPPPKLALLHDAVMRACDAGDGLQDGLLADPRKCDFKPETLLCRGADGDDCLTAAQVETVKRYTAPAMTTDGKRVYAGMPFGGELAWQGLNGRTEPAAIALDSFRYLVYGDANWDWRTFDLDRDTALVDQKAGFLDAVDPDLRAFQKRGGKLLMAHGWSDPLISPLNTVDYYSSILEKMGPGQGAWLRLFMVPGMGHCGGGEGPNQVNWFAALERWRESGAAPDSVLGNHVANNRVDMSRPICAFPKVATYSGIGSVNDAGNFVCK